MGSLYNEFNREETMRILISGATQGLGEALVLEALSRFPDAQIVGFSRSAANVEALKQRIAQSHPEDSARIHLVQGDIGSGASITKIVVYAQQQIGGIDVLINNVGLFKFDREVAEIPEEDWELDDSVFAQKYRGDADFARKQLYYQMVRTNYIGNRNLLNAVVAAAARAGGDLRVIDVGSIGVVADLRDKPMQGTSHYGRSKGRLARHTISLPEQHSFIRVAIVHPGPFEKSAQLIADEYGDTWAVDVRDVAKHTFDLFSQLDREKLVQGVIAAEEHFFWQDYPGGKHDRKVPKSQSRFITRAA
jgi:NAD(P)-dependent dehydrogenase (short-subunit alcohol dehydrogenase family)